MSSVNYSDQVIRFHNLIRANPAAAYSMSPQSFASFDDYRTATDLQIWFGQNGFSVNVMQGNVPAIADPGTMQVQVNGVPYFIRGGRLVNLDSVNAATSSAAIGHVGTFTSVATVEDMEATGTLPTIDQAPPPQFGPTLTRTVYTVQPGGYDPYASSAPPPMPWDGVSTDPAAVAVVDAPPVQAIAPPAVVGPPAAPPGAIPFESGSTSHSAGGGGWWGGNESLPAVQAAASSNLLERIKASWKSIAAAVFFFAVFLYLARQGKE